MADTNTQAQPTFVPNPNGDKRTSPLIRQGQFDPNASLANWFAKHQAVNDKVGAQMAAPIISKPPAPQAVGGSYTAPMQAPIAAPSYIPKQQDAYGSAGKALIGAGATDEAMQANPAIPAMVGSFINKQQAAQPGLTPLQHAQNEKNAQQASMIRATGDKPSTASELAQHAASGNMDVANENLNASRTPEAQAAEHAAAQASFDQTQANVKAANEAQIGTPGHQTPEQRLAEIRRLHGGTEQMGNIEAGKIAQQQDIEKQKAEQARLLNPAYQKAQIEAMKETGRGERQDKAIESKEGLAALAQKRFEDSMGFKHEQLKQHGDEFEKRMAVNEEKIANAKNANESLAGYHSALLELHNQELAEKTSSGKHRLQLMAAGLREKALSNPFFQSLPDDQKESVMGQLMSASTPAAVPAKSPPAAVPAGLPEGAIEPAPGVPDGTTGGGGKFIARGGHWYKK